MKFWLQKFIRTLVYLGEWKQQSWIKLVILNKNLDHYPAKRVTITQFLSTIPDGGGVAMQLHIKLHIWSTPFLGWCLTAYRNIQKWKEYQILYIYVYKCMCADLWSKTKAAIETKSWPDTKYFRICISRNSPGAM